MNQAQYLDHAIRRDTVNHKMSWFGDTMLPCHQPTRGTKMQNAKAGYLCNQTRPWKIRRITKGVDGSHNQSAVAVSRVHPPPVRTFKQDSVDPLLGASDNSVGHSALVGRQPVTQAPKSSIVISIGVFRRAYRDVPSGRSIRDA